MVRKRIPLVTRPDQAYAFSLPQQSPSDPGQENVKVGSAAVAEASVVAERTARTPRNNRLARHSSEASVQIDVRVTALSRQKPELTTCGIAPRQVIRAALRKAVKKWEISANYTPPSNKKRAGEPGWTVRTSVAVPAATLDRLLAEQDPLGVDSRWSLVRGQLEPLVWAEIDTLLDALRRDHPET